MKPTILPALSPRAASDLAVNLADGARSRAIGASCPWGAFASLACALRFCEDREERLLVARKAARLARDLVNGPLSARLAASYRDLAILAFRAARWQPPAMNRPLDLGGVPHVYVGASIGGRIVRKWHVQNTGDTTFPRDVIVDFEDGTTGIARAWKL